MDLLARPEPIVWVQQLFGYGHQVPFLAVDELATNWGAVLVLGLALWVWGREDAYAIVGVMVGEALFHFVLNWAFETPRPSHPSVVVYDRIELGSFPSGHVFTVTALWGLLWLRGRVPLWWAALVVAAVGVGRLYLGAHYLEDVLGGIAFAAVLLALFVRVWPPVRRWLGERPEAFFTGMALATAAAAVAVALLTFGDNPFQWNSGGLIAGGSLALLLEWKTVRYRPEEPAPPRVAAALVVGLAGIVPLLLVDRFSGEEAFRLGMATVAVGALWALWATPWLLARMGVGHALRSPVRASLSPGAETT